jgi:cobalt-precorrin-5B (C1)-methyltransferase
MSLGWQAGYTTGSCAAAAAKAAMTLICGGAVSSSIEIPLPDGSRLSLPLLYARPTASGAEAAIRKDGGDDPDVTTGLSVEVEVEILDCAQIEFRAGQGVGSITLPGLALPVGEPAINPGPRAMIAAAVREASPRGCRVTVSIPGGAEIASQTFNPRLGIAGGLSVLGTSGRVRPFSLPAMRQALACGLDVALANGTTAPVLVPGNIGGRAARRHLTLSARQVVETGNEWGFLLDHALGKGITALLALGHPGKLAKLWLDDWDTHSSRSHSPVAAVRELASHVAGQSLPAFPTVEGVLMSLSTEQCNAVSSELAERVRRAIELRVHSQFAIAVALINLEGNWLASAGDISPWR